LKKDNLQCLIFIYFKYSPPHVYSEAMVTVLFQ